MAAVYANSANQIAALKELYTDDIQTLCRLNPRAHVLKEYMKDLVYKENPFLALVPKNESPDGFAGEIIYLPALNKAKSVNPNETKLVTKGIPR